MTLIGSVYKRASANFILNTGMIDCVPRVCLNTLWKKENYNAFSLPLRVKFLCASYAVKMALRMSQPLFLFNYLLLSYIYIYNKKTSSKSLEGQNTSKNSNNHILKLKAIKCKKYKKQNAT